MGVDTPGQDRVNSREMNNRRSEAAKGMKAKAPVKQGAKAGFGSNSMRGRGKIMKGVKSRV